MTLCVGKVVHGIMVTIVMITASKLINESVPVYLLDKYGAAQQVFSGIGLILVLGFGTELPQANYDPRILNDPTNNLALKADQDDEFWRALYLMPVAINILMLSCFVLFINEDPIMFNIGEGRDAQAMVLINKIYDISENRLEILENLKL